MSFYDKFVAYGLIPFLIIVMIVFLTPLPRSIKKVAIMLQKLRIPQTSIEVWWAINTVCFFTCVFSLVGYFRQELPEQSHLDNIMEFELKRQLKLRNVFMNLLALMGGLICHAFAGHYKMIYEKEDELKDLKAGKPKRE